MMYEQLGNGRRVVYVIDVGGGSEHRLLGTGAQRAPAWSPDGTTIAVIDGSSGEAYLVASDGSTSRRLTTSIGHNLAPSWAPDGRSLVATGIRWPK